MGNYLITGAAGGMGAALCRTLTAEGHRVWGLDRASGTASAGWTLIPADITGSEAVEEAFRRVRAEAGSLDGIIHMAGVYDLASLVEMPEEDFLRDFNVNLFGVFRINRQFLPLLAPGGRIVIVTSELAPLPVLPFTGVYAVTKAALDKYAEALRMELQLLGHPVIVLRPGAVDTGMLPDSTEKLARFCGETKLYSCNAARFRRIVERVEARSVPPEKIAEAVCRALRASRPKPVYTVNRSPLLLLFRLLPPRLRLWAIRTILS
jgi:NAD(P)-dependent dehydrogenase (short-subunit alcohol dehydrogenase family)